MLVVIQPSWPPNPIKVILWLYYLPVSAYLQSSVSFSPNHAYINSRYSGNLPGLIAEVWQEEIRFRLSEMMRKRERSCQAATYTCNLVEMSSVTMEENCGGDCDDGSALGNELTFWLPLAGEHAKSASDTEIKFPKQLLIELADIFFVVEPPRHAHQLSPKDFYFIFSR